MRPAHLLLFLLILTAPAQGANDPNSAPAGTLQSITIVDYGIYTLDDAKVTQSQDGISRTETTNERLALKTKKIPANVGVNFGFRFKVEGAAGEVKLTKKTTMPPAGLQPPGKPVVHSYSTELTAQVGAVIYTGYGFDESWEGVPGTWKMELWYENRKVAEQTFTVEKE
jgi:hypothetical protein